MKPKRETMGRITHPRRPDCDIRYENASEGVVVAGIQSQVCSEQGCEYCTIDRPAFFRAPVSRFYKHDAPGIYMIGRKGGPRVFANGRFSPVVAIACPPSIVCSIAEAR